MNINEIKNWKSRNLKEWLNKLDVTESWFFDWKGEFNNDEKGRLKNAFAAFANEKGGLLFFGILDDKKIIGIKKDNELATKINKIIGNQIKPTLRVDGWSVINAIKLKNKKIVYIVYVKESPYYLKPHLVDSKIYIRTNGENRPIEDGRDVRSKFIVHDFNPEDIELLEKEMKNFYKVKYCRNGINYIYMKKIKEFLRREVDQKLSDKFNEIFKKHTKLCTSESRSISDYEEGKSINSVTATNKRQEKIRHEILDFCFEFKNKYLSN